jgi:hypothetical protein
MTERRNEITRLLQAIFIIMAAISGVIATWHGSYTNVRYAFDSIEFLLMSIALGMIRK